MASQSFVFMGQTCVLKALRGKAHKINAWRVRASYVTGTVEVEINGPGGNLLAWSKRGQDVEAWLDAEVDGVMVDCCCEHATERDRLRSAICEQARDVYRRAKELEAKQAQVQVAV